MISMLKDNLVGLLLALIVVLCVALAGMYAYHKAAVSILVVQLEEAQEQVGDLTVAKASLETQKLALTTTLDKQNKLILELSQKQEIAKAEAEKALAQYQQAIQKWQVKYSQVLNAPKPVAEDCQAFSLQLNEYIMLRKQEMRE